MHDEYPRRARRQKNTIPINDAGDWRREKNVSEYLGAREYLRRPDATGECRRIPNARVAWHGARSPENAARAWICINDGNRVMAEVFCPPYPANSVRIEDERLDRHNEEVWRIFVGISVQQDFSSTDERYRCEIAEFTV